MFRISRFQQLLQFVPRGRLQSLVDEHQADRYTKAFGCYDLLVAQVFGNINGSRSLRELETGFNAQTRHHYHLGTGAVRRTTLADASAKRSPHVFEGLVHALMASTHRRVRQDAKACLRLLDATSFTLKGRGFDEWTAATRTRHTQGLKLHMVYASDQQLPTYQAITAPNVNDITQAWQVPIVAGETYVFDKGYCDYNWWARLTEKKALFVTRLKRKAKTEVVKRRSLSRQEQQAVLADEHIRLSNKHPGAGRKSHYNTVYRRVTVARPDHATPLELITNDFERTATDIADCYKARWEIELFFKWIKQNLRIRAFYGRSENAVRIQILCALITYLLLALYRAAHAADKSLRRTLDELRAALFQRASVDRAVERRRLTRMTQLAAIQPGLFQ